MTQLTYDNIFDAITDDEGEAADLEFRADLMLVIRELFEAKDWKQADIMTALDITQPRASELTSGKVDKCSSDKLIGYLAKLGYRFKPTYKAMKHNKSSIQCTVKHAA